MNPNRHVAVREDVSALEHQVLAIFRECLHDDTIGADDDFIRFGGDSLASARVLTRCQELFGVALQPSAVFESPTARALARTIEDLRGGSGASGGMLVPLKQGGSGLPLFFIHALSGDPRMFQPLIECADWQRPIYAPRAPDLAWEREVLDVQEMASQYAAAIRLMQPRGPYSLLGYSFGAQIAFEIACRLVNDGQEVSHLVMLDGLLDGTRLRWLRMRKYAAQMAVLRALFERAWIPPQWIRALGFRTPKRQFFFCMGTGALTAGELVAFLRLSSVDETDAGDLMAAPFTELCRMAAERLRTLSSPSDWESMVRRASSEDPVAIVKAQKVRVKNRWHSRLYRPSATFPGTIVHYVGADNPRPRSWQDFARDPLEVRHVDIVAVDEMDEHNSFWRPQNVMLYVDDLRRCLEGVRA